MRNIVETPQNGRLREDRTKVKKILNNLSKIPMCWNNHLINRKYNDNIPTVILIVIKRGV